MIKLTIGVLAFFSMTAFAQIPPIRIENRPSTPTRRYNCQNDGNRYLKQSLEIISQSTKMECRAGSVKVFPDYLFSQIVCSDSLGAKVISDFNLQCSTFDIELIDTFELKTPEDYVNAKFVNAKN